MKKLLYITDQQEYAEHGTIGPLFNGYLKAYYDVYMVYFTRYKHSFQCKGNDFIVPEKEKKDLCSYLEHKALDLASYEIVLVRNMSDILKNVLKNRARFHYKVGYRISFPKSIEAYEVMKAEAKTTFMSTLNLKWKYYEKRRLISRCDIFLPTSSDMQLTFFPNSKVLCHPLPAGLDPARIKAHEHLSDDFTHFIYVGTLDKLREFDLILEAFSALKAQKWQLCISTHDPTFVHTMLVNFSSIREKIQVLKADTLDELMEQVNRADIGIALLPERTIYRTSVPAKVMDYYTCSVPALLSDTQKNRSLFTDDKEAFFCDFSTKAITLKLKELMTMTPEKIMEVGQAGQQGILLHERNYDIMAKNLFKAIEGP